MINVIIVAVILAIVGLAAFYVYRSKKKGRKCIGCPGGTSCNGTCSSCSYKKEENK